MARGAYLGTDLPDDQLRVSPPPSDSRAAAETQEAPAPGALPPAPPPGDGMEDATDIIAERAMQYMNMSSEELMALDSPGWTQLMNDLERGYPDDVELLRAIDDTRAMLAGTQGAKGGVALPAGAVGAAAAAEDGAGMRFNPDPDVPPTRY